MVVPIDIHYIYAGQVGSFGRRKNDIQKKCRKGAKFAARTAFSAILGEISCLFSLALEFFTRFRGGSFQPLTHLSAPDNVFEFGPRLTPIPKELLQQFRAPSGENATANLNSMIQLRVIHDLHHGVHRAGLRVVGAVDQALYASMHDRASAHRARLNCNKQLAAAQAVVTDVCAGLTQRNHLGVRGGVGIGDVAIPSTAHDASIADNDRTNRNLAGFKGPLRRA
jgi:hypothetical protein